MGLSTYLKATNYISQVLDKELYNKVAYALEGVIPLGTGERYNSHPNIEITVPLATWHKAYSLDTFLYQKAGSPDADEYELDLSRDEIAELILQARNCQSLGLDDDDDDDGWVAEQFLRLERVLTDFLLDDNFKGWTLKVWRSY